MLHQQPVVEHLDRQLLVGRGHRRATVPSAPVTVAAERPWPCDDASTASTLDGRGSPSRPRAVRPPRSCAHPAPAATAATCATTVVDALFAGRSTAAGVAALRFDFRGVGRLGRRARRRARTSASTWSPRIDAVAAAAPATGRCVLGRLLVRRRRGAVGRRPAPRRLVRRRAAARPCAVARRLGRRRRRPPTEAARSVPEHDQFTPPAAAEAPPMAPRRSSCAVADHFLAGAPTSWPTRDGSTHLPAPA